MKIEVSIVDHSICFHLLDECFCLVKGKKLKGKFGEFGEVYTLSDGEIVDFSEFPKHMEVDHARQFWFKMLDDGWLHDKE